MEFKQGDTFDYSGAAEVLDENDQPVDLTGWSVESNLRFPDLCKSFSIYAEWLNGQFTHIRLSSSETSLWPAGEARMDVAFTSPDAHIVSTETVSFKVVADV